MMTSWEFLGALLQRDRHSITWWKSNKVVNINKVTVKHSFRHIRLGYSFGQCKTAVITCRHRVHHKCKWPIGIIVFHQACTVSAFLTLLNHPTFSAPWPAANIGPADRIRSMAGLMVMFDLLSASTGRRHTFACGCGALRQSPGLVRNSISM